ncbi:hypothetical protein T440DRAFT_467221 [Plenodomus tracheiphilus IPT5]|uniref:Secreted protein n=1 Tax=Plenodomus tracheiphilus IPT5 TaxID=1408161 RepID=A0A6A7B9A3_9PLEO|nr:hypothetical protein T440DRAFT_467221 [Plenodomus tracheiphilus IPT5]
MQHIIVIIAILGSAAFSKKTPVGVAGPLNSAAIDVCKKAGNKSFPKRTLNVINPCVRWRRLLHNRLPELDKESTDLELHGLHGLLPPNQNRRQRRHLQPLRGAWMR